MRRLLKDIVTPIEETQMDLVIPEDMEMSVQSLSSIRKEGGDHQGEENKDHEEKIDIMDELGQFLMTMPPNWEKAEKHAEANLVLKADQTTLNFGDKNSYCICCHQPFPANEDYFSLCCSNSELAIIGSGYPLLFELMKHIAILMFVLTILYFLPVAFMIYTVF